jgi:hypothetical protein
MLGQSTTGDLEGWVFDTNGSPIVAANVTVTSADLQGTRGIATDERGFFRLLALPSGKYTVHLRHVSFQPVTFENVQIWLGKMTTLPEARLNQSSVEMGDVVVSGERPLLDPTSTTGGANLTLEKLEALPLDRNYRSIASILPNATQSYYGDEVNIAGSTGSENRYFINGSDVTDMYGGLGGTNLPYNFIREIEVKTGGYEPEYRSSLGGVVNVVTHSGGNDFSGQVFGFYTNSNFGGQYLLAPSDPPKGDLAQYDFGLALGGPIVRDQLWFFAAIDPSYRNEDVRISPLGYFPDQLRTQPFAGKLSWKASEVMDITATLLGDPSEEKHVSPTGAETAANPDPYLGLFTTGGYSVMIDARHAKGQDLILQGSAAWTARRQKHEPFTERGAAEVTFVDATTATTSGGYFERTDVTTSTLDLKLSGTVVFEDHILKAGVEYRQTILDDFLTWNGLTKEDDTTFIAFSTYQNGRIRNHVPSVFVQDSWSASTYLRITGGLRWDGLFIIASNGNLVTRVLGQFQPRFGFVFMPAGDESHKIFASIGRYAEDLMVFGSTFYHIAGAYQAMTQFHHDPRVDPSGGDTLFYGSSPVGTGVQDLRGQYYDELTLGYEQLLAEDLKFTTKGTYRALRQVIEDAEEPVGSGEFYYGNPGEGRLAAYPHPRREYLAFEVALEKSWGGRFNLLASYVLSRNYGNYLGFFLQEIGGSAPNGSPQFDFLGLYDGNATGLLPNDRTHIFKLNAAYHFDFGLTCAASFFWETGTPLSEYQGHGDGLNHVLNLVPRGSAGRLPSLWDLNIRLAYTPIFWGDTRLRPRLILDIFHLGSRREVVLQDQLHYQNTDPDGNPVSPNPTYGMPQSYQPPVSMRLGIEVSF